MINELENLFRGLRLPKNRGYKDISDFLKDEKDSLIHNLNEIKYDKSDPLQYNLYTALKGTIPLIEEQFNLILNDDIDTFISNIDECFYKTYVVTSITDLFLYRIRSYDDSQEEPKFEIKEIFHRPFNLSGKHERYDTPQIYSFYLSTSLNIAWYETGLPFKYTYTTVIPSGNLKILNLNICPYLNIFQSFKCAYLKLKINNSSEREEKFDNLKQILCNFLTFYPLLLSCSLSVRDKKDETDIPKEYHIPNLLLDWIRKNDIDGIKYSPSTYYSIQQEMGANYVFPAKTNRRKDKLFCDFLIQNFILTQPQLQNGLNDFRRNIDEDISSCSNLLNKLYHLQINECQTTSIIDCLYYCKIIIQYLESLKNNTIAIKEAQSFFYLCKSLNTYFQSNEYYAATESKYKKILDEIIKITNNYYYLEPCISIHDCKFKKISLVQESTVEYTEIEIDETTLPDNFNII